MTMMAGLSLMGAGLPSTSVLSQRCLPQSQHHLRAQPTGQRPPYAQVCKHRWNTAYNRPPYPHPPTRHAPHHPQGSTAIRLEALAPRSPCASKPLRKWPQRAWTRGCVQMDISWGTPRACARGRADIRRLMHASILARLDPSSGSLIWIPRTCARESWGRRPSASAQSAHWP